MNLLIKKILNIQRNIANPQSNVSDESSVLSQLKKAKELLDMEAIAQEEFDNIKRIVKINIITCK